MTTSTSTSADNFTTRADAFASILDGVGDQWDAPTPCDGWTVRDVVGHAIETEREFLQRQELDPGAAPDLADPAIAWGEHAAMVADVLARDGVAHREYDGYFGRTTVAATMADFYGWDLAVHGSDIARATGQPWSVTEAEAAELLAGTEDWGDSLYSEGVCGPAVEVAPDASPTDRLLATLGRDPRWEPTLS
jgi:uncharacterized protein (TIGR03086 family)